MTAASPNNALRSTDSTDDCYPNASEIPWLITAQESQIIAVRAGPRLPLLTICALAARWV
jgi:hypothetical protein